jgi:excisionase family DNA binding protein
VITVSQAAEKLGLTTGRIRQLILAGRIRGARKLGSIWVLPDDPVVAKPKNPQGRPAKK